MVHVVDVDSVFDGQAACGLLDGCDADCGAVVVVDDRGAVDVVVTGKVIVVVVDDVLLVKEERISTRRSRSESEKRGSGND
jgi:hypothetical protein